jgi:hypothetical protein
MAVSLLQWFVHPVSCLLPSYELVIKICPTVMMKNWAWRHANQIVFASWIITQWKSTKYRATDSRITDSCLPYSHSCIILPHFLIHHVTFHAHPYDCQPYHTLLLNRSLLHFIATQISPLAGSLVSSCCLCWTSDFQLWIWKKKVELPKVMVDIPHSKW